MTGTLAPALLAGLSGILLVAGLRRLAGRSPAAAPTPRRRAARVERWPAGRTLAARLRRAGLQVGPDAFAVLAALAAIAVAAACILVLRLPILAPAGVAAVTIAASAVLGTADRRHAERLAAQLPGVAR